MNKERDFKKIIILSTVIFAVSIIMLVSFLISRSNKNTEEAKFAEEISNIDKSLDNIESASSQLGKSIEDSKNEEKEETETFDSAEVFENKENNSENNNDKNAKSENQQNKKDENKSIKKEENKEKNKEEDKEKKEKKEEKVEFEAPLKGEIIREFAKDSLVFSDTLQEWITHNAVDIKADKTSVVKAAAEGTVSAIKNDPRYGLTVIIDHQNGYKTIYSNLLTAEFVVEKEKVTKGQSIGTVGNTAAFEISDEYHLHFELLKDNEYQDPTIYMNF